VQFGWFWISRASTPPVGGRPHRVNHPFGAAEPGANGGDPAVHDRHIADGIHAACRVNYPAATNYQSAHIATPAAVSIFIDANFRIDNHLRQCRSMIHCSDRFRAARKRSAKRRTVRKYHC